MLKSYFKTTLRSLKRRKGYAFLNVSGLALGLAACLLIGLYVQDELSYDRFHVNADRTYRVLREFDLPDLHSTIDHTPPSLAPTLQQQVPAVEAAVRVQDGSPVVQRGTQKSIESGFLWADPGFFEVFSFPLLRGRAALEQPSTVVLSEAMAAKYFPGEDPVGQTLRIGERDLEVTGIAKVFGVFAGLAILIGCLGLFGLAAYTAQQRTKEIGIRKALGASVTSIVGLLSKDFLKLVAVAVVLAAPVAYFAMSRWLEGFAYRIDLSPWVFLVAGASALLIALATVSYQALRAARTNPTDALRAE